MQLRLTHWCLVKVKMWRNPVQPTFLSVEKAKPFVFHGCPCYRRGQGPPGYPILPLRHGVIKAMFLIQTQIATSRLPTGMWAVPLFSPPAHRTVGSTVVYTTVALNNIILAIPREVYLLILRQLFTQHILNFFQSLRGSCLCTH